jgi:subtilisin family serine protease
MPRIIPRDVPRLGEAWALTRGEQAVVAVVDGDLRVSGHPEFDGRVLCVPGASSSDVQAAEPASRRDAHGVKVAGLALAGGREASGIAPGALLLPVPLAGLHECNGGPTADGDAMRWAADQGADVICCAWAPRWPDSGGLPPHTRRALDYCLTHGREGKGCVIAFSAGNDGSDIALNGYASHPGVIAVGACNCHGTHPSYSGWGDALWCVFPSNDPRDPVGASMTYLTTAPTGSLLDGEAFYTTRFGFTSAACAAVAGICALIVSADPELTATEVKHVLRDTGQ